MAVGKPLIEQLSGQDLERALPDLARLRIEVFYDFPYLYAGSHEYELRYLKTYLDEPEAVVVGCRIDGRLVGAATALPLRGEPEEVRQPLAEAGYEVDRLFYFGESILEKQFRGCGIGVRFFEERLAAARASGSFTHAVFCAVIRPDDHPSRPIDYRPLDDFWRKRGFGKITGLTCRFAWTDVGDTQETAKPMAYWIRPL